MHKPRRRTRRSKVREEMLQIRLIKGGSSGEGGGGAAKSPLPADTVTVACPDHLVLADLPVAKSLGASNASYTSAVKSAGRRSRRHLGERVHFCVCCDYPIAIYGRLIPCEHSFCLACARSDSSCYLCDERIQKIQTIKMMEGIYICAAPHCLKSFLKKAEFESHIHETHTNHLHLNMEREGGNESDGFNITRPSSTEAHAKQSMLPESSTARAPSRPGFSPNSQVQDRDDKARRHQSREQTPLRPPLQPKAQVPFHVSQQSQVAESQPDNNPTPPQGNDRPYNWFAHPQSFDSHSGPQYRLDSDQFPPDKNMGLPQESSFAEYPPLYSHQLPTYPVPVLVNPPPSFSYPPFPAEGSQPSFYNISYEIPRPEMVPEGGSEPGSLLGFPPVPTGMNSIPDNFPRPWSTGLMLMPFEPSAALGQGVPEGYVNSTDSQGRTPFFQGEFSRFAEGLRMNPPLPMKEPELQGGSGDQSDGKGILAPLPMPLSSSLPPPPPLPSQPHKRGKFSNSSDTGRVGQGFGWQNDDRRFGNRPD